MEMLRKKIAKWLGKKIYENSYIFVDRWTIIHIISGFLIMRAIDTFQISVLNLAPFMTLFVLLSAYEVFEVIAPKEWFRKEKFKDMMSDIVFGMLGGVIYLLI
jgi:hypothetical protein